MESPPAGNGGKERCHLKEWSVFITGVECGDAREVALLTTYYLPLTTYYWLLTTFTGVECGDAREVALLTTYYLLLTTFTGVECGDAREVALLVLQRHVDQPATTPSEGLIWR